MNAWRPVLAGVFLLILRMPSTVIDTYLYVDKTHHRDSWLGGVILIAVSCLDSILNFMYTNHLSHDLIL